MDVFTYIYIYIYITPTGETPSKTAAGAVEGEAVELATPDPLQKPLVADPGNQQDDPPSTTSQKRSPMLIVPKNWDVPIQQGMVDIFTMAKTGAPEPRDLILKVNDLKAHDLIAHLILKAENLKDHNLKAHDLIAHLNLKDHDLKAHIKMAPLRK